ncbi:hypothetical protein [Larkinella soli]|uniref:hypothetical protein n=1 Tax=Larkinella soli TaxID=1770527 RepID=UPI000FFB82EE|nr:hypothetical protein [Larkinella soli]
MPDNYHLISEQIDRIAGLQSGGDRYFPAGLFPSYRANPLWLGYRRPDANVFFTAITVFTLRSLLFRLPEPDRKKVEAMTARAVRTYPDFRNKDGLKTYNFYRTPRNGRPSGHFPNGRLLHRLDHFRLPDDADDTAMIYLTTSPSREELLWLKEKLAGHANLATRQVRNTYADYRSLRAYSTWFGKAMYVEFDACVLSNLLYCIYRYDLPLNDHDLDSLTFIRSVIETGRYRREPFRCSHSYPRTALILYHVARLLAAFHPGPLAGLGSRLIEDGFALLQRTDLPKMDRLVVSSSLLRLGEKPALIDLAAFSGDDLRDYSFFIAGMLTAYENRLLYRLAPSRAVRMTWTCEAHTRALLTEYLVLSENESV